MSTEFTRRQVLAGAAAVCSTTIADTSVAEATARTATDQRTITLNAQPDDVATVVRSAVSSTLQDYDADGATVAVVENGEAVLTEGFGHAYLNPDVPVKSGSTLFRIGSVSKVLPYVAAMRLVDEERVNPHAPASEALDSVSVPDSDAYEEPVTLKHLATHTSGFDERSGGQIRTSPENLRSLPNALQANSPKQVHPPGELPMYTNYNAGLTGQLVADVLDTKFESAIQRLVFAPLGMTESTFDPLPKALTGSRPNASEEIAWYHEMTPAAGMSTTANDMAHLLEALVTDGSTESGRVLSQEAVNALHRQWYTPHKRLAGASFGMARQRRDSTLVISHTGYAPDFRTDFRLLPEEGIGLFVSVHGSEVYDARKAITEAFLSYVAPVTKPKTTPSEMPPRADELTGTYRSVTLTDAASFEKPLYLFNEPAVLVRLADNGGLVTKQRRTIHHWVEVTPLVFRRADGEDTLVFRETDDGGFHLFRASEPRTTLNSVPWYEQAGLHGQVALVAGIIALSGAIGWPLAAAWRYVRDETASPESVARSRWAAGGSVLASIAFLVVSIIGISEQWLYIRPQWFGLLFAFPIVGAVLAFGAIGFTLRVWHRKEGSLFARIHLTTVTVALAAVYSLLWYWNLLQLLPK